MKKSKLILAVSIVTLAALLTGCWSTAVVRVSDSELLAAQESQNLPQTEGDESDDPQAPADGEAVKTGFVVSASLGDSKSATAEENGTAQADLTLVAVTVTDDGVIDGCAIDSVQAKVKFDASGALTSDVTEPVRSKVELGTDYGMGKVSAIGKEWDAQVKALADYVVGKTVEELHGIAVTETGRAADVDLAASCSISIAGYLEQIAQAAESAQHLGAAAGDRLVLTQVTSLSNSVSAGETLGMAKVVANLAALTLQGDTITSCILDSVQAEVAFDKAGAITTDLTALVPSKNQLGADYGLGKVSAIGKEWNEQAAAFAAYITGKTVAEVTGLAVTETGGTADADLAASCSIAIGSFQGVIAKAGAQ